MWVGRRRSGFESLARAYSGDLYRFAYWLCRDRFLAEELVQETYARAWASWPSLRDERAAKHWLFSILRHEHARLYERKRLILDDGQELDELPAAGDMGAALEMREALERLPCAYREPLLLQVLGGFTCAEIGEMLGINEGAVMQRVSRARRALRELVAPERVPREKNK